MPDTNLGERVAPEGQLDPRRQPGAPYFEPAGARVMAAVTNGELERQRQGLRLNADVLDYPRDAQAAAAGDPPEVDGNLALAELERAVEGAGILLGPAVAASLTGVAVRDEWRERPPSRLERIRRALYEAAGDRDRHAHRATRLELEVDRLTAELERAQAAHDAQLDRAIIIENDARELVELRRQVRYFARLADDAATVARQLDRRHTGDARTAGSMLRRARIALAAQLEAEDAEK